MKNEKFLLDIQTKCGDITNEILNAAIDAERTFKCKWPWIYSTVNEIYNLRPGALANVYVIQTNKR